MDLLVLLLLLVVGWVFVDNLTILVIIGLLFGFVLWSIDWDRFRK